MGKVNRPGRGSIFAAFFALVACLPAWCAVETEISGNSHFSTRQLRRGLPPIPEEPDAAGIREWMADSRREILRAYEDEGFLEAAIESRISGREGDWSAAFKVREGQRFRVDSVLIRSAGKPHDAPEPEFPSGLPLQAGDFFSQEDFLESKRRVLEASGNGGFMRTQVGERLAVDTVTRTVTVEFVVRPGRFVTFDTLVIRNSRESPWDSLSGITREDLIRSLSPYRRGDTVRFKANDRFLDKLQATGAFEYVALEDSLFAGGDNALILTAVEDRPGRLRGSLFYDTDYLFGATLEARHGNVFGSLNEVGTNFTLSQEKQGFGALYGSALTWGKLLRFDEELDVTWYQSDPVHEALGTPPFRGDFEARNSARLSRPFFRWLRLLGSLDLAYRSHVLDLVTRQRGWTVGLTPSAFLTFLDNPLEPRRGARFAFTTGVGSDFPGGEEPDPLGYLHTWVEGFSAYYLPLFVPELVLAARLDAGRFFGRPDIGVPRFYLGGPRSVRSFPYKSICPLRRQVVAAGETVEVCLEDGIVPANVLASLELRIMPFGFGGLKEHVPGWLRDLTLVPFADAGKVWDTRGGLAESGPGGEGISYGLGLRYPLFSIFNVRLDFAWGRDGADRRNFAWIVDLAHAF